MGVTLTLNLDDATLVRLKDAAASRDMVLVGHSMGGVLSRLLVSSSGSVLLDAVKELRQIDDAQVKKLRAQTDGLLTFEAYPGISRAIFINGVGRDVLHFVQQLGGD